MGEGEQKRKALGKANVTQVCRNVTGIHRKKVLRGTNQKGGEFWAHWPNLD